jgi:hypothetical protein
MKPKKVLCKRTYTLGDDFYHSECTFPSKRITIDNRIVVEGHWYDVIYNTQDNDKTFTIRDNQGNGHLYYIYDTDDEDLPRTYTKWFFTEQQIREEKLNELLGV